MFLDILYRRTNNFCFFTSKGYFRM